MSELSISILTKDGELRLGQRGEEKRLEPLKMTGENHVHLSARKFEYKEGDRITIQSTKTGIYLVVKLDETLDSTLIYLGDTSWTYPISFKENLTIARPATRFAGNSHYLSARIATKEEISMYQNLAFNPHDTKEFNGAYPHASANVETRNESTFFACNAIDGVFANHSHGPYPFQSWGINQQKDAALTIDFGREVELNRVGFTLRADFPHDNYWKQVSLHFSDGSKATFDTQKTAQPQYFTFTKRTVTSVTFCELIQSEEPSPFPALTQIECFGWNKIN